jgi:hypothetical protein
MSQPAHTCIGVFCVCALKFGRYFWKEKLGKQVGELNTALGRGWHVLRQLTYIAADGRRWIDHIEPCH